VTAAVELGGMSGFGPVVAEIDEPPFHEEWERRVLALTLAMGATGSWTLDASRFAREDRPLVEYVSLRYYDLWFRALTHLLVENGLVGTHELEAGNSTLPAVAISRRLEAAEVKAALRRGSPVDRPATSTARFAVGDAVITISEERSGHTRLPRYAAGKLGSVTAVHGCHVFPDTNAHGLGEQPQWLYTVEFSGTELFGPHHDQTIVSIDAFEPHLEPA